MTVTVAAPGLATTVQDRGRPGFASQGVSPSGAFDRAAMLLANRLVGNAEHAAVLEALGGGLELCAGTTVELAVTGAEGVLTVDGAPVGRNSLIVLRRGSALALAMPSDGLRSYVAVRGGFDVPPVLGSRSWDSLGHLGPPPLTAGQVLPIGLAAERHPVIGYAPVPPPSSGPALLHLVAGPREMWFPEEAWRVLASGRLRVSPRSDRVGVRLDGGRLDRWPSFAGHEIAPEGLVRGAVEIPPDGCPIVLGPDHPTTGGYPVLGVVARHDQDRCAQLTPGQTVVIVRG